MQINRGIHKYRELFHMGNHETPTQRFPLQTGSWLNNATPTLAKVIGTNNNTTEDNETGRVELPPLTETQCKSKI